PHSSHHLELRQEVVEIERSGPELALEPSGVFGFYCFSSFFHQPNDVAHPKNPSREPLRNKHFELIKFFTCSCEFDGPTSYFAHRQRRAAPRVAIEFGQDNAGDCQCIIEMGCYTDRLLSGRRIHNEENFLWLQEIFELLQLLNQRFVEFLPACRVKDIDVSWCLILQGRGSSALHIFFAGAGYENGHIDFFAERRQLVDCCWPL